MASEEGDFVRRYLLIGSLYGRKSSVVEEITQETDGLLAVRSMHDRGMHRLLNHITPNWRNEPTLIEVEGSSSQTYTGHALRMRLLSVLGLRRTWRVAQLIAELQAPSLAPAHSRRGFLRRSAQAASAVAGLALLGPPHRVLADDVGTEGKKKPGKYSREAGIRNWKVKETSSGYNVDFEHKKDKVSGELKITFSDGGRTGTTVLKRDKEKFQLAFSERQLAATDSDGKSMVARWNGNRKEWEIDEQSRRKFEDNKRDLEISFAIAADLSQSLGASAAAAQAVVIERQGTCDENAEVLGVAADWLSSRACDWATKDADRQCKDITPSCKGCCRILGSCDPFCPLGFFLPGMDNFGCNCLCVGHPYERNGTC